MLLLLAFGLATGIVRRLALPGVVGFAGLLRLAGVFGLPRFLHLTLLLLLLDLT